jgi:hypothetical protein
LGSTSHHDDNDEVSVKWKVYVSGMTWSDEGKTFDDAVKSMKGKVEEKNNRFVEN